MSRHIPKILHQIWIGESPPAQVMSWMRSWQSLHSDWEYRLWTDADVTSLKNFALAQHADTYAAKADVLRVDILAEFGGVYVDADYEARRRVDSLVHHRSAVLLSEGLNLTNSFMGFAPGHPLVRAYQSEIEQLTSKEVRNAGDKVLSLTGPLALTRAVAQNSELLLDPAVVTLAPDYFLVPKTRSESLLELSQSRRFATHHAAASWRKSGGIAAAVRSTRLRTRLRRFFDLSAP